MKKLFFNTITVFVSMLAIAACDKTGGDVTPEPIKCEGYIQIDDNEEVHLDVAKVFNNGMYWRCVFYDSEMYKIESLSSLQDIKAEDGAKGLVVFDWIIGEGFDPAAEGQYPEEEHIYWEPAFYADIIKGDKIWSFVIGDDSMPGIYDMQFTKEKLEISFDGKYNLIDYTTFNNDQYGDVKFEYTGSYEMVKLGHNGYYTADNTYHELKYCGIQRVGENDEDVLYAVLMSPDPQSGTLTALPERFIAITYEYPKPDSDYQNMSSYVSSYRFSNDDMKTDVSSGYSPIPVQELPEVFINVNTILGIQEPAFEVCFRGEAVEMNLPENIISEYFNDIASEL